MRKAQLDYIAQTEVHVRQLREAAQTIESQNESLVRANTLLRERATEAMESLSAAVDARDSYTAGHSRRVQQIAVNIGRELGLDGAELESLSFAALFHDIGKLAIPDAVLLKNGPLQSDEWWVIRRHAADGERIVGHLGFLADSTPAIRHHHEHFDGSGYPDGLKGQATPLGARIIHVADAFDSMSSDRAYRDARSPENALAELRHGNGRQFCPRCVTAFETVFASGALDRLLLEQVPPRSRLTARLHGAHLHVRSARRLDDRAPEAALGAVVGGLSPPSTWVKVQSAGQVLSSDVRKFDAMKLSNEKVKARRPKMSANRVNPNPSLLSARWCLIRPLHSTRMPEDRSVAIALEDVSKRFGKAEAVRNVTLAIGEGEFFSLLGPSGCGKTTTLRMIAGFEVPDEGRVVLQGRDVTAVTPNRRPVNMVFQQYALFPHMSIYDNIAFGLKVKRVPRSEHRERVYEMLRVVELEGLERRRPRQLSGGQQQRVALARALVNRPAALLLDEPLGALDVKLRKQMQLELKRIQAELGTTFVYVTHDQEEALAMSDRVAVMNGGQVEQVGGPREIYEHPETAFVADFIGSLNALELTVDELVAGYAVMRLGEGERVVVPVGSGTRTDDSFRVAVRPERVQIGAPEDPVPDGGSRLQGTIAEIVYLGMYTQFHVETRAGRIVSHRLADELLAPLESGSRVVLSWEPEHTSLLGDSAPVGGL